MNRHELTFKEAAALCGVAPVKLCNIKKSAFIVGAFPEGYRKKGIRGFFYKRKEVVAWLENNPDLDSKSNRYYQKGFDSITPVKRHGLNVMDLLRFPVIRRVNFTGKGKVLQTVHVDGF